MLLQIGWTNYYNIVSCACNELPMALSFVSPASWCSLVAATMVHFVVAQKSEDYFALRAIAPGMCATFTEQHATLVECDGSQNQLFYSEGELIKSDSNTCLTAAYWPANPGDLKMKACDGSEFQKWNFSDKQQLRLSKDSSMPDDYSCVFQVPDQPSIAYVHDVLECGPKNDLFSLSHWDRFYIKAFQSSNTPFQVLPSDGSGCLVAASSNGPVSFVAPCSQASEALFDQTWYYNGTHIRNLGFYSGACMEPAADHFSIQISECVESDAQKWYFNDGVFRNGVNDTQGHPQCLTIRSSLDYKPIIADCDGRDEKEEQQLKRMPTQWNISKLADHTKMPLPQTLPFQIYP